VKLTDAFYVHNKNIYLYMSSIALGYLCAMHFIQMLVGAYCFPEERNLFRRLE